MPEATFYTPDGDEIDVDAENVVHMYAGEDDDTTVLELEDGTEITVVASQIEVAAELGLNPLDYLDPDDDDESIEGLKDESEDE